MEEPLTHMKLADVLGLSSQALTWHMKRLESMGVIERGLFEGQSRAYRLVDGVAQKVRAGGPDLFRPLQSPDSRSLL